MTDVKDGKLSDIMPDVANANQGTERGMAALESSLRKHGAGRSILLDRQGRIIAGNKTVEKASDIGLDDVIIVKTDGKRLVAVQREDLDLADDSTGARELAYSDNRVGELDLSWNPEQVLADLDSGVDLSGLFREDELSEILGELGKTPKEDPGPQVDKAAELQAKWGTSLGQIWELGEHRLACGDCTDRAVVENVRRGERAEMMFADPPYGIKRDEGFEGFGGFGPPIARRQYKDDWDSERPSKETFELHLSFSEKALIFGGNFFADILPKSTHWVVWDKLNTMPTFGDCELIWTNLQRKSVNKITFQYNGLIGKEKDRFHPTQKPLGVYELLLNEYSEKGNAIFDPFLGSGTTLIACEQLGRKCRGIEIDPDYVGVTLERWQTMTGKDPVLTNA